MDETVEQRLAAVEAQAQQLRQRVERLETIVKTLTRAA